MPVSRAGLCLILLAGTAPPAQAAEISSAYSDFDPAKDCTVYSAPSGPSEGNWRSLVCKGWRGYPVFLSQDDERESLFYGFPTAGVDEPRWESFSGFNAAGPRIEWRLEGEVEETVPFAAIHRFSVAGPDGGVQTEVLVVKKVGQPDERQGCAVGLVLASGNARANEEARRIADERARGFDCGADKPVIGEGVPDWSASR